MIAAAQRTPYQPRPLRETGLWEERATEFSGALNNYCTDHMPGFNKPPKRRAD
jgi:hypothetical protein